MSGFLDRLRARRAATVRADGTSGTINPAQWLIDWIRGGEPTAAGVAVNPESAMRLAAVYACVRVIAEDVAKVPLHLYRRLPGGGRDRADDRPAARVLRRPNAMQTGMEMRETMTAHAVLRGAGYGEIIENRAGDATGIVPLDPARTTQLLDGMGREMGFRTTRPDGTVDTLPASRVLYLRGLSLDGVTGCSPVTYHRETIGLGHAALQMGARQLANDIGGSVFLQAPDGFAFKDAESRQNHVKALKEWATGKNKYAPIPLEWGFRPVRVAMTNEDAQYIEGRKLTRSEIAAIFRVPPHKIGDLEKATFSNIEHQAIEYVVDTLLSWYRRWELRLDAALLSEEEQEVYFFEHLVDGLLRGDIKARYEAYQIGRNIGTLSRNDVRRFENQNPLSAADGGDDYRSFAELQNATRPTPAEETA
jgi:HK97 family phage portal protein